ncbi:hypothetical protein MGMO_53c00980 [Methyloglobulus morosus KoM1]|uniref:Uncharacterized protein n=1 Tax=Methyloglobulus morosus KoM1 TaxID=1116472 RepID=V5BXS2_9GAMM|nr:hypothetical protein [Methyloglobulus morosus]ESS72639.1 hypothetical protein MGMO_53c00980 [Methyloglobulus morosus KoM1]
MKILSLFLIPVFAVITTTSYAKNIKYVDINQRVNQSQIKSNSDESADPKYAAYLVDGTTSASKLAAQRSHTVAGKDERNFAIFSGITAILIVYFFSQFEFFDK